MINFHKKSVLIQALHLLSLRKVDGGGIVVDFVLLLSLEQEQVRLSRATLEFQAFQVPTGLKVFKSQVIYLISFNKILRSEV